MVSQLAFSQRGLVALVRLFLMLSRLWPSAPAAAGFPSEAEHECAALDSCSASPNKPTPLQPCCRNVALACTPAAVTFVLCAQDGFAPYRGIAQVTYGWGLVAQGEAAPGLALWPQGLVAGRRV